MQISDRVVKVTVVNSTHSWFPVRTLLS